MKCAKLFLLIFFTGVLSMHAQVTTWLQPTTVSTNMAITIEANQVLEILSLALDPSSSLDVVRGDQKVTLGSGGNPNLPYPLVLAGPATITLRKTSTGGQGSLMTFRIGSAQNVGVQIPVLPFALQK